MSPERFTQLLALIGSRPGDSSVASLVADELMEAGDARGEFISLVLSAKKPVARQRMVKLFTRHRELWLGPLATQTLGHTRLRGASISNTALPADGFDPRNPHVEIWENGFPVRLACLLDGSTRGAPQWQTIRELWLQAPASREVWPVELEDPMTSGLRRVSYWPPDGNDWWEQELPVYLASINRLELLQGPRQWAQGFRVSSQ